MALYPGQKVVCVSAKGLEGHFYPGTILPVANSIYTVRELLEIEGRPLLRLIEIRNFEYDFQSGVFEPAFHRARFRPLVGRQTDITVFERLLTPAKQLEDA